MDLNPIADSAEELINEIRQKRMSVNVEYANDLQNWLYNIATICIGLGGALIPLAYSTNALNRSLAVIGSIILILNGISILLHKKIWMGRDGRTVAILGFMQEAISLERIVAVSRVKSGAMSLNELRQLYQSGVDEVKNSLPAPQRRRVSYISDVYFGLLYAGLAVVISSIISANWLRCYVVIVVALGTAYMSIIIKSTILAKRAEQDRYVYEKRIEDAEEYSFNNQL